MDYPALANVLSGLAWAVAYYAIVYRGMRDKSFGMPLIPLALNLGWEFFHSVVYPEGASGVEIVITYVWLAVDVWITALFLRYGYRHYKDAFGVSKAVFYGVTALAFVSAFFIMGTGIPFFAGLGPYFGSSLAQSSYFIAYLQNLVISAAFIGMLWLRRTSEGQSLWIAITKMIGTSLTVGIPYLTVFHPDNWHFMAVIIGTTFVLDLAYTVLIYQQLRREGRNPFTRM